MTKRNNWSVKALHLVMALLLAMSFLVASAPQAAATAGSIIQTTDVDFNDGTLIDTAVSGIGTAGEVKLGVDLSFTKFTIDDAFDRANSVYAVGP